MEQVKIFYAVSDRAGLETHINEWLKEKSDQIEVTKVTQAASGRLDHHVTVVIFYKNKHQSKT